MHSGNTGHAFEPGHCAGLFSWWRRLAFDPSVVHLVPLIAVDLRHFGYVLGGPDGNSNEVCNATCLQSSINSKSSHSPAELYLSCGGYPQ